MPVITIFSGIFCLEEPVIRQVISDTGYKLITDNDIVKEASAVSGIAEAKIIRAFNAKNSIFNKFTHEKERSIAHLKFSLANMLFSSDNFIISGFTSMLVPEEISHVLRVCLIADMKNRLSIAGKRDRLSENEAAKKIHKQDENCAVWINTIFQNKDPWAPSLYDIVIPVDKASVREAAETIIKNLKKDVVIPTEDSKKAVYDFRISASVEIALANEGHNVQVSSRDGLVTIIINKHVLMLNRLEEELKSIAEKVKGVKSVETKVSKDYYKADIYRKYDFELPSKVLLVDDEREFAQTLSERLLMRDMGSAIAYDGESALKVVSEDEPEVMILDLKMPGIDGIEVLHRVKQSRPDIEVIILTGHGSEADKEVCMKLGAFAYLHKPVDINVLSETLKKANEKIRNKLET